jgi:hypothetical protein
MPVIKRDDLRARSFTVAQHITGEKRPVVFLHTAEAEVERLREYLRAIEVEASIARVRHLAREALADA